MGLMVYFEALVGRPGGQARHLRSAKINNIITGRGSIVKPAVCPMPPVDF